LTVTLLHIYHEVSFERIFKIGQLLAKLQARMFNVDCLKCPLLWSPYVIGQTIIFSSCGFFLSSSFFFFYFLA